MIERPTARWRADVQDQALALAAGNLPDVEAYAAKLWPADFIAAVDAALEAYDVAVARLSEPSDEEVLGVVKSVVFAVNAVNTQHGSIATGERDDLCQYIEEALVAVGVDIDALASRRGLRPNELTDEWRTW